MKPLRVYADTSVFGGCFDAEFATESKRFFDLVRRGGVKLVVSEVVVRELAKLRFECLGCSGPFPRTLWSGFF
jgi:hypothetical protein